MNLNTENLSSQQLDNMIELLTAKRELKLRLIKDYQAKIDAHYQAPVKVQRPTPKMDIKTFWTKNISSIIHYLWDDAPICFCCMERSIFEVSDEYSKYSLCLDCGKQIIYRTSFPVDKIEIEF
jgi:hypothetical protein